MRIIGVDPGTGIMGFGVIEASKSGGGFLCLCLSSVDDELIIIYVD